MSILPSNHLLITEILLFPVHYKHGKSVFSLSTLLQQVRMATCILAPLQRRRLSDRLPLGLYKAAEEARTKTAVPGTSLVVQWLRLHPSIAAGTGSIPGWGTKIPHAAWCGQKLEKQKNTAGPLGNVSPDPLQNGFWPKFGLQEERSSSASLSTLRAENPTFPSSVFFTPQHQAGFGGYTGDQCAGPSRS